MATYYAKSANQFGKKITAQRHMKAVSRRAGKYASKFGMKNEGELVGILHDFGKYSDRFQGVLKGKEVYIDHAFPGARLFDRFLPTYIAEVIAGHHDGLVPGEILSTYQNIPQTGLLPSSKYSSLQTKEEYEAAAAAFFKDFPKPVVNSLIRQVLEQDRHLPTNFPGDLLYMMKTRMLLSCLVDADYSVSAYEGDRDRTHLGDGEPLNVKESLARLEAKHNAMLARELPDDLRALREMVWTDCGKAAAKKQSYMTLTAPMGAGKTMGYLRYALAKCAKDKTRKRIILVLPHLALVDQVAALASEIIPGTIVDTCLTDPSGVGRDLVERWSAPCIVTTSAQFLGSLFSSQPEALRKLHRISDAVVVFDEFETIPDRLAKVALESLHLLVSHFNADILLSTAFQPGYERLKELDYSPVEIIRNPSSCFALAPAEGIQCIQKPKSVEEIADMAARHGSCCVIVNTRLHARAIYQEWEEKGVPGIFLLSADLCPAHRRNIFYTIQERLKDGRPVRVVATPCIESDVDLDFERVYRAMAPLPELILSAGLQNRNRRRPRGSISVFVPAKEEGKYHRYPDGSFAKQTAITQEMSMRGCDLSSKKAVEEYYSKRFLDDLTTVEMARALKTHHYKDFESECRFSQTQYPMVIVPYDQEFWASVRQAVGTKTVTKQLLRQATRFSVQSHAQEIVEHNCIPVCLHDTVTGENIQTGVWLLPEGFQECYNGDTGLYIEEPELW